MSRGQKYSSFDFKKHKADPKNSWQLLLNQLFFSMLLKSD